VIAGDVFSGTCIHKISLLVTVIHRPVLDRTICLPRAHPLGVSADAEVNALLQAGGGLVTRRDHLQLAGSFDWLLRERRLAVVLPGVYAAPAIARSWQTRVRAVALRHPDAVLLGGAAARVSFWPDAPLDRIEAAVPCVQRPQPGFSFNRRAVPPDLIAEREGLRYSVPALTAIDIATFACSDAVDVALRVRATTLTRMYEALRKTPHRAGNRERLKLLIDSRNEPWSAAERLSHRLLRAAGIKGWETNLPVRVDEQLFYIDIAFRQQKLAIEIDGRIHETDQDLFESDRWRQNALVAAGWRVLRFTMAMLRDHPEAFIAAILDALH
jgi:very-short-patch-repair endonuclease